MFSLNVLLYTQKNTYNNLKTEVKIGKNKFITYIADTPIKQMRGLSKMEKIDNDKGMLFIFNTNKKRTFWMKNMNFPIDIIWINGNKIIKISKDIQPPNVVGKILTSKSDNPVDKVLEINAGLSDKLNIRIGDKVDIISITNDK